MGKSTGNSTDAKAAKPDAKKKADAGTGKGVDPGAGYSSLSSQHP
jgi:hypothetical protein